MAEDYTYETPLMRQMIEAQAHMADDLAAVDASTFDQRTTALLAKHEQRIDELAAAIARIDGLLTELLGGDVGDI